MGLHSELRDALEEDRSEIVRVLAEHRVLPEQVDEDEGVETASLLGGGKEVLDFQLVPDEGTAEDHNVDRQTRKLVVEDLGIDSAENCESVQEEIRSHENWGDLE